MKSALHVQQCPECELTTLNVFGDTENGVRVSVECENCGYSNQGAMCVKCGAFFVPNTEDFERCCDLCTEVMLED